MKPYPKRKIQPKIWGVHSVEAAIRNHPDLVNEVYFDEERFAKSLKLQGLKGLIEEFSITIKLVSRLPEEFKDHRHQGVWAILKKFPIRNWDRDKEQLLEAMKEPGQWVVLNGIEDPRNYGSILRSAAAFGVKGVIVSKKFQAPLSGVVSQSSSGMIFCNQIVECNHLKDILSELAKYDSCEVLALDMGGVPLQKFYKNIVNNCSQKSLFWLFGSEGRGIDPRIKDYINQTVAIPMNDQVESLNVSVTAGIVLQSYWGTLR